MTNPIVSQRDVEDANDMVRENVGLFQQQKGTFKAAPPPTQQTLLHDALEAHRKEIDRITKHVVQLQSELADERKRAKNQADVIADLMSRVRALEEKPIAKKKRGTV